MPERRRRGGDDRARHRGDHRSPTPSRSCSAPRTTRPDVPWVVIVWNDPVNMFAYVIFVFQKLFGYSRAKASKLTNQVHYEGKAVVANGTREKCEADVVPAARVRPLGDDAEGRLNGARACSSGRRDGTLGRDAVRSRRSSCSSMTARDMVDDRRGAARRRGPRPAVPARVPRSDRGEGAGGVRRARPRRPRAVAARRARGI